jgi:L-iditol 2-dehydrogenase
VHAFQLADIKMYETIAIIGQGPMGLAQTDLANAIGIKAIALALRDFPLSVANKLGAWATVNSSKEDPVKKVLALTDGFGVDSTYLQVGGRNLNPLLQALQMTKKSGKVMVVGLPTGERSLDHFNIGLTRQEKTIMDVSSFSKWDEYSEAAIALDYMTRGKLHPADIITHRFPLEEINEAFDVAARKKETNAIKVMLIQDKD